MIKKDILLNPVIKRMDNVVEPPLTEEITWTDLSMDEANQYLSHSDKCKWVKEQNKKGRANLYFVNPKGDIQEVEPSGWWY